MNDQPEIAPGKNAPDSLPWPPAPDQSSAQQAMLRPDAGPECPHHVRVSGLVSVWSSGIGFFLFLGMLILAQVPLLVQIHRLPPAYSGPSFAVFGILVVGSILSYLTGLVSGIIGWRTIQGKLGLALLLSPFAAGEIVSLLLHLWHRS